MPVEQATITLIATRKFLGVPYGKEVVTPGTRADFLVRRGADVFDISAMHARPSDVVQIDPGAPNPLTGIVTETRRNSMLGTFPPDATQLVETFDPQVGTTIRRGLGRTVRVKAQQS